MIEDIVRVITIIHRNNDIEEKWFVVAKKSHFIKEQIKEKVLFTE